MKAHPDRFFFLCYFIPFWVDVHNETKRVLSFVQSNDASRSGTCFMTLGVAIQRESSQWGSQIFGLVVRTSSCLFCSVSKQTAFDICVYIEETTNCGYIEARQSYGFGSTSG